jgi:mRNA degradation ribonuclease J1/J2
VVPTLRVLPLGGLGEIGKNMTVVEYDGRIVVVDAGVRFPTAEMHGIDLVLPDFSYITDRADRVDGIVLTHGHEDHVGALPWLLRELDRERAGMVFVDGLELGDPTEVALRDRRALSKDGVLFVVATVSQDEGDTLADHEIVLRGIPMTGSEAEFVGALREAIETSLDRAADDEIHEVELVQQTLHDDLAAFVYERLGRRPMILPVVVEV